MIYYIYQNLSQLTLTIPLEQESRLLLIGATRETHHQIKSLYFVYSKKPCHFLRRQIADNESDACIELYVFDPVPKNSWKIRKKEQSTWKV